MAEISWTREAETWLKDIYDYIAADSPDAAARAVNGIPKPDTSTKLNLPAPSEFFSIVIIESPI